MVVLMLGISLAVVLAVGMAIMLFNPNNKMLKTEKKSLQLEIDNLKEQIAKRDKQLEAWRVWVPWYVTEKETDGTQE